MYRSFCNTFRAGWPPVSSSWTTTPMNNLILMPLRVNIRSTGGISTIFYSRRAFPSNHQPYCSEFKVPECRSYTTTQTKMDCDKNTVVNGDSCNGTLKDANKSTLTAGNKLLLVTQSAKRIAPYIHRTPIMTSSYLNELSGQNLHFKCEMFQKTGSFKFRGAMNSVVQFSDEMAQSSHTGTPVVVADSSGNHGQALALAAKLKGMKAYIVTPTITPRVKKLASSEYGAEVVECEPSEQARQKMSATLTKKYEPLSKMIPSYYSIETIAAQGTAALEILQEIPNIDAIVIPVGSGGLLAGCALAAKGFDPSIKVYGAEPLLANDAAKSFKQGVRMPLEKYPPTIAEGLKINMATKTWPIIQEHVDDILTVTEDEIAFATETIWERMKLVVETSGAVTFAVTLTPEFKARGHKNVGVILSGGNVDFRDLPWLNERKS